MEHLLLLANVVFTVSSPTTSVDGANVAVEIFADLSFDPLASAATET